MANLTDALVRAKADSSGWALLCVSKLVEATDVASKDFGFVDENGVYMPLFDPVKTWGINYDACQSFCSTIDIPYPDFSFPGFANSFTNWLLPWLTLVAQLPYQTESPWGDLMSLFLSIGSPALATYSLCLSVLNRYHVHQQFKQLRDLTADDLMLRRWPDAKQHLHNVRCFLQEAQQAPIRLSQVEGWLSSLIVCSENHQWWQHVCETLARTRRAATYSFWAQTLAAIVAWIFTVGGSVVAALGNEQTALQLSASTQWIWMLPVVSGWILVGTQSRTSSIDEALRAPGSRRALEQPEEGPVYTVKDSQKGIRVGPGLAPQLIPQRAQTSRGLNVTSPPDVPLWMGLSRFGDEGYKGPIYNYARIFTWHQASATITESLKTVIENIRSDKPCQVGIAREEHRAQLRLEDSDLLPEMLPPTRTRTARGNISSYAESSNVEEIPMIPPRRRGTRRPTPRTDTPKWDERATLKQNLGGDALHTATYCGLEPEDFRETRDHHEIVAYTPWKDISVQAWNSMAVAALFALLIQWGSAGSSILIAFNTPTAGLGCRSGSYAIYGVVGTSVWLLLTASMLLSHGALLEFQKEQQQRLAGLAGSSGSSSHSSSSSSNKGKHKDSSHLKREILSGLAVATRVLGKALAVLNGTFLILSSFFEIIGVYDNCWCESIYVWRGESGWVTIFKTNSDLVSFTERYWVGGIIMSTLACLLTFMFFALSTKEDSEEEQ